ncbi:MAG TPA: hypothetical protein IGS52_13620 [Oscillatoriaceae cyanobacterium M33_DOE_052]|nr:hypothetical protein [Oscillatoriaceae cyanobacterium M33_DOE_052]
MKQISSGSEKFFAPKKDPPSPRLPVSPSPRLPVSPSPRLPGITVLS